MTRIRVWCLMLISSVVAALPGCAKEPIKILSLGDSATLNRAASPGHFAGMDYPQGLYYWGWFPELVKGTTVRAEGSGGVPLYDWGRTQPGKLSDGLEVDQVQRFLTFDSFNFVMA